MPVDSDDLPVTVADPAFAEPLAPAAVETAVLAPVSAAAPVVKKAALASAEIPDLPVEAAALPPASVAVSVAAAVEEAAALGEEFVAAAAPPADAVNLS